MFVIFLFFFAEKTCVNGVTAAAFLLVKSRGLEKSQSAPLMADFSHRQEASTTKCSGCIHRTQRIEHRESFQSNKTELCSRKINSHMHTSQKFDTPSNSTFVL